MKKFMFSQLPRSLTLLPSSSSSTTTTLLARNSHFVTQVSSSLASSLFIGSSSGSRSFSSCNRPTQFQNQTRSILVSSPSSSPSSFSVNSNTQSLLPKNVSGKRNVYSLLKPILDHYDKNHIPPSYNKIRPYGAPFTDTKNLEKLPESILTRHLDPQTFTDKLAYNLVKMLTPFTHAFFRDKYHHHAVVLETVAAVPGMVAGVLRHFRSLRKMQTDHGWVDTLVEEAENERMHLLTWMRVVEPTFIERMLVIAAQLVYIPFFAGLYITSPKTAHRFVGYLEEEAVAQYTLFLNAIDQGKIPNGPAPEIALKYWNLSPQSTIRDVVLCVRADEAMHRDVNHFLSEKTTTQQQLSFHPPPVDRN